MNCSRSQQLLSPYLDQQLTGAEMLEVQQHLAGCGRCTEDYRSARQVKSLLRSLGSPRAETSLESRILSRLAQEERRSEAVLPALPPFAALPALWQSVPALPSLPPPSRGRRLTASLVLSCLVVFAAAAPFAPSTPRGLVPADGIALDHAALLVPMPSAGLRAAPSYDGAWVRPVSTAAGLSDGLLPADAPDAARTLRDVQPPLADTGAEPLGDEAASGYVSGDVAFVGYRVR